MDHVNRIPCAKKWKHIRSSVPWTTFIIIPVLCLLYPVASAATGPEIALDKTDHDFGDVRVGRSVQARVSLSNKGDAPLIIQNVRTSCGCAKAENASK